ncbi:hypothetical protein AAC387_Pa06g0061 [Persea americana]
MLEVAEAGDSRRKRAGEAVAVGVEEGEEAELGDAGREGGIEIVVADVEGSERREVEDGGLERAVEGVAAEIELVQVGEEAELLGNVAGEVLPREVEGGDLIG